MAIYISGNKTDSIYVGGAKEPTPIYVNGLSVRNIDQPSGVRIADCIRPAPSVTSWGGWFASSKFEELDLSSWDTSKVTSISEICSGANLLKEIKMGEFTVCTDFSNSLRGTALSSVKIVATLDSSKKYKMDRMFISCPNLEVVDFSQMVGKVQEVSYAFESVPMLRIADLSGLDFTEITSTGAMFTRTTPTDCLVLVKDQANKDWFTDKCSNMTNVQIKE